MKVTEEFKIPVPPLEIQCEIVHILDSYSEKNTQLIKELYEEIELRKKQYEYYRDLLLNFGDSVELRMLGEIADYAKDRINTDFITTENYVSVENLLKDKKGKTIAESVPKLNNVIGFKKNDILIGNIRPYLRKIWFADCNGGTNGDVLVIHIMDSTIIPKFLFYILSSERFFIFDIQNSKGAKMPRGDKNIIMQFQIPIPPIKEQERIVAILDRFDSFCNDLTSGIPAEISTRQKQYEYYRDKLLTFREKN